MYVDKLIIKLTYKIIQEYGVEFSSYFNVMWKEPRLHIPTRFLVDLNDSIPSKSMIPVNLELVRELWLPNIFIYNLKTFKVKILKIKLPPCQFPTVPGGRGPF